MEFYQTRESHLLRLSNILLRVPSIFILELLYRSGTHQLINGGDAFGHKPSEAIVGWGLHPEIVAIGVHFMGYVVAFLLHALPISKLLELYRHILVGILLVVSHTISTYFLSRELHGLDSSVAPTWEERSLPTILSFFTLQTGIALLCGFLMHTRHLWVFSAYLLPVLTRLIGAPVALVESSHIVAETFVLLGVSLFILTHILVPYQLALDGLRSMRVYVELYGIVTLVLAIYNLFFIPLVYLVFWSSMFLYHLYTYLSTESHSAYDDHWVLVLLTTIANCCVTPWSLIGFCFVVSYGAYIVLASCKLYLRGFFREDPETDFLQSGWTEGITLLILALQMGLLQMHTLEKALLLSAVLFIVMLSTFQTIYELIDAVLLWLGASNNRNQFLHIKVLALSSLLFVTPVYISYQLFTHFPLELWLLILVSSCMFTSVQIAMSVMVYLLFMLDHRGKLTSESLDDRVYCIHALRHVVEFTITLLALLCVAWDGLNGNYDLLGTLSFVMHVYFSIWQRGKKGWDSFLLRRNASKKVQSLPEARQEDLQDVCAICYEDMKSARVTPCCHFFHTVCLRRWLYVQATCPMCHSMIAEIESPNDNEECGSSDGDSSD